VTDTIFENVNSPQRGAFHERFDLTPGEFVRIMPDFTKANLFDEESGNRLTV
jgi:hypothetical protein